MLKLNQKFIPVLNSEAGLCLTGANWKETGAKVLSVKLVLLMVKPGVAALKSMNNLNQYLGWEGDIILNCGDIFPNKQGTFTVVSSYDGSKLQFSYSELLDLILHLKPKALLLPHKITVYCPDMLDDWNDSIFPFFSEYDFQTSPINIPHGIYYPVYENDSLVNLQHKMAFNSEKSTYLFGSIKRELIHALKESKQIFIESDIPADHAMNALVYAKHSLVDLNAIEESMNFTNITEDCSCPTCSQHFTKAYLHHLYRNTPLLCQRFLIQHNIAYILAAK